MIIELIWELDEGYNLNGKTLCMRHLAMQNIMTIVNKDYPDYLYITHEFVRDFSREKGKLNGLYNLHIYLQK